MNSEFYNDLKSFYHEHKYLTIGTFGLAAVGASLAKLAGRTITWIKTELLGTTKKVNDVQQTIIPRNPEPDYYYKVLYNHERYAVEGRPNLKMRELKQLIVQNLSVLKAQNINPEDLEFRHGLTPLDDNLTWNEYVNHFSGTDQHGSIHIVDKVFVVVKKHLPPPHNT